MIESFDRLFFVPLVVALLWLIASLLCGLGIYKPKLRENKIVANKKRLKTILLFCLLVIIGLSGFYKFGCNDLCKQSFQSYLK